MLTPAEELLAAVVKHATADVDFNFERAWTRVVVMHDGTTVIVRRMSEGPPWVETVSDYRGYDRSYSHASASSAVYSAFLRARGKQL